jgi:hypothetical protein
MEFAQPKSTTASFWMKIKTMQDKFAAAVEAEGRGSAAARPRLRSLTPPPPPPPRAGLRGDVRHQVPAGHHRGRRVLARAHPQEGAPPGRHHHHAP